MLLDASSRARRRPDASQRLPSPRSRPPTSSAASPTPPAASCPAPPSRVEQRRAPAMSRVATTGASRRLRLQPAADRHATRVKIELQGFALPDRRRWCSPAGDRVALRRPNCRSARSPRPSPSPPSRRCCRPTRRRCQHARHREGGAGPAGERPQLRPPRAAGARAPTKALPNSLASGTRPTIGARPRRSRSTARWTTRTTS